MALSETDEKFLILESLRQQKEQFDRVKIDCWTHRTSPRIIYTTWILIIPCFRIRMSLSIEYVFSLSFFSYFSFFNARRYYNVAKCLVTMKVRIWNDMEIYGSPFYLYEKCHIAWNGSCNFGIAWHWVNERQGTLRIISKSRRIIYLTIALQYCLSSCNFACLFKYLSLSYVYH